MTLWLGVVKTSRAREVPLVSRGGLFVTQGGHGVEAAGAQCGNVAGGAGDDGEGGGGEAER